MAAGVRCLQDASLCRGCQELTAVLEHTTHMLPGLCISCTMRYIPDPLLPSPLLGLGAFSPSQLVSDLYADRPCCRHHVFVGASCMSSHSGLNQGGINPSL